MGIESSVSLGEKTADGVLYTGEVDIARVLIITDGSNDATVILYNSASTQPTVEVKIFEMVVAGSDNAKMFEFSPPINCSVGLYLDIEGTGASCIVYTI